MSRHYRLCALSDPSKAARIAGEIGKVDGVRKIRISEDLQEMDIDVEADLLTPVMDRVVNICSRISYGCEVKFKFT